jgi:hypothetical protein
MSKMKKSLIIASLMLLILALVPMAVKADVVDQIGGLIAKAPYIVSPTNSTYASFIPFLNVSFQAAMYANLNYTVTYRLDDENNGTVPLTAHYFGFDQQTKNYYTGSADLPQQESGSHKLTVYVTAEETTNANDQVVKKDFHDSQTVFFTVSNANPSSPSSSPSVPEFPVWIAPPLLVAVAALAACLAKNKKKN